MEKSLRIQYILSQIKELDYDSKLSLAERLIKQLRLTKKSDKPITHKLSELNTLGSEVWKDVNIEKYVEEERQWD